MSREPTDSGARLRLGGPERPGEGEQQKLWFNHRDRGIVLALVVSLVLWQLPAGGLVLYPFKLLATWMHEISHGLVMALSGAGFDSLKIYRDTSGIAYASAGTGEVGRAAIASAGYVGASLFGAVLLVMAQTGRACRIALGVLAVAMGLSAFIWIDNQFGELVGYGGAVAFGLAALLLPERWASWALSFVAAQACVNAVLDIRVLFRPQLMINGEVVRASDAHKMAEASFGSPTMWAAIWLGFSFVCFFVALRVIYLRERDASRSASRS